MNKWFTENVRYIVKLIGCSKIEIEHIVKGFMYSYLILLFFLHCIIIKLHN